MSLKLAKIIVLIVALMSVNQVAVSEEVITAKAQIQSVSLFKNGLAFFRAKLMLPEAKKIELGQLPVPAYGTFWVNHGANLEIKQITAANKESQKFIAAATIGELLHLNVGKRVKVWLSNSENDSIEGVVMNFGKDQQKESHSPYFMGITSPTNPAYSPALSRLSSSILIIKTCSGIKAVNTGSIRRIDFIDKDIKTEKIVKEHKPSIVINLERTYKNEELKLSWLSKGLTWAPSYQIDLSDSKNMSFTGKALVINEVMDLDAVNIDFVTGYPNIQFGEIKSPIALQEKLAQFLRNLSRGNSSPNYGGPRGQMMTQQAVMLSNIATYEDSPAGYSSVAKGKVSEDLFLYPVKNVCLKRGETAYIPLFKGMLPYRHIYTWQIGDYLDDNNRYRSSLRHNSDGKLAEEIWHSCRFKNTLDIPLTTAAAEFIKDDRFVGQDICYYTAPMAQSTIRINRAMNVLAEQAEFEEKRERNAATFHGYRYDKVIVRGELKIKSRLDKDVDLEITKELSGELIKTEPVAKDSKVAKGLRQVNPKHNLVWEVKIKSGESRKIHYQYEVYVRN
jgi:hypothetical protein